MTENLMQKIEEKVLGLLNELELMRAELVKLRHENTLLREDKGAHEEKLQGLIALLDVLDTPAAVQTPVAAQSYQQEVAVA